MIKKITIKSILKYLDQNNHVYNFIGNSHDNVTGYSTLFNYKAESLTFVSSLNNFSDYETEFKENNIKLIITSPEEKKYSCFSNVIQINKPKFVFFELLEKFFDTNRQDNTTFSSEENQKYSYISPRAQLGKNVTIGSGSVIEDHVWIGDNTVVHHNVIIKNSTTIGRNCSIYSGVVIGERGFNPFTNQDGSRTMLKHYGGVTIEDDVHIGDNSCINRGAIDNTIIKKGAKLNTMVHIAHNCIVGKNTVITMPTHVCGSVIIGNNCHIAATTIRNQCQVGDNAILGLGSVVVKNVEANTTVVGNPAKLLKKKER